VLDRIRRAISRPVPIEAALWDDAVERSELLGSLSDDERARARGLAGGFLHRCRLVGARGFEPDERLRVRVAGEACTLLAGRAPGPDGLAPLDAYRAVRELVLYPGGFRVTQRWTDEDGVAHEREAELAGEAWQEGPVILARDDVEHPGAGFNVVVHEFAHVLDAGNGFVNGFPTIEDAELRKRWPDVFQTAFADLQRLDERGLDGPIDPYALEDPGEFFAVASEAFFTDPHPMRHDWPKVYAALSDYYAQRPHERFRAL